MRIFFAGVNLHRSEMLVEFGVKNFLASYEKPKLAEEGAGVLERNHPGNAFLLDSGAFAAWNSGVEIDLKRYIEFAKDFKAKHSSKISHIYVANLDVIPGRQGTIPTYRDVEDAAKQGWENMLEMERGGITPVHIFHQGEDFEWLRKLSERHRYIGISPSNDSGLNEKHKWLRDVFSLIKAKNMTHGFAVTARKLMASFPWYSVDSTSWMAPSMWGKSVFSKTFEEEGLTSRCRSHVDYVIHKNVRAVLDIEKKNTVLWARRGVVWDEDDR